MRSVHKLGIEKRIEAFGRRRQHHVDQEPKTHRFAGELFGLELKDRARQQKKDARSRLQATRPVGIGFGEKDNYGPDESWDTKDLLKYIPVPNYYNVQKNF
jgi:hypothetical protein